MCTILFSYEQRENEPLILLANRDEFYDRPTIPAGTWEDEPGILAGRDLVGGGTWLGVTTEGRIAAVTNYRDANQTSGTRSRGELVANYLRSNSAPLDYMNEIAGSADDYSGFNLLTGLFTPDATEMYYFSNRREGILRLEPGLYGVSNHLLDTPWQKTVRGKSRLSRILSNEGVNKGAFFELLADHSLAPDAELPDTGIGYEKEKVLSAIFIETPIYGTRSSTVVIIDREGNVDFEEKVFV